LKVSLFSYRSNQFQEYKAFLELQDNVDFDVMRSRFLRSISSDTGDSSDIDKEFVMAMFDLTVSNLVKKNENLTSEITLLKHESDKANETDPYKIIPFTFTNMIEYIKGKINDDNFSIQSFVTEQTPSLSVSSIITWIVGMIDRTYGKKLTRNNNLEPKWWAKYL